MKTSKASETAKAKVTELLKERSDNVREMFKGVEVAINIAQAKTEAQTAVRAQRKAFSKSLYVATKETEVQTTNDTVTKAKTEIYDKMTKKINEQMNNAMGFKSEYPKYKLSAFNAWKYLTNPSYYKEILATATKDYNFKFERVTTSLNRRSIYTRKRLARLALKKKREETAKKITEIDTTTATK